MMCRMKDTDSKNSTEAVCINQEQICDGRNDCPEGDDEKAAFCCKSLTKFLGHIQPLDNFVDTRLVGGGVLSAKGRDFDFIIMMF